MGERRRRINRICHRIGVALFVTAVVAGAVLYLESLRLIDYDERMEMSGAALFFPAAAVVGYLASRAVGWFVAELVD